MLVLLVVFSNFCVASKSSSAVQDAKTGLGLRQPSGSSPKTAQRRNKFTPTGDYLIHLSPIISFIIYIFAQYGLQVWGVCIGKRSCLIRFQNLSRLWPPNNYRVNERSYQCLGQ